MFLTRFCLFVKRFSLIITVTDSESYARIAAHDDTFLGWIATGSGQIFILDVPTDRFVSPNQVHSPWPQQGKVCFSVDSESIPPYDIRNNSSANYDNFDDLALPSCGIKPSTWSGLRRRKRTASKQKVGPASPNHTVCTVYVDVDPLFYDEWKGVCSSVVEFDSMKMPSSYYDCELEQRMRVLVKAIDILHQAAGVFDRVFKGAVIKFAVSNYLMIIKAAI